MAQPRQADLLALHRSPQLLALALQPLTQVGLGGAEDLWLEWVCGSCGKGPASCSVGSRLAKPSKSPTAAAPSPCSRHSLSEASRGRDVLTRLDLARVNDRVLTAASSMLPENTRSLDAIHLATAQQFGADLTRLVTYDDRMARGARALGLPVAAPS